MPFGRWRRKRQSEPDLTLEGDDLVEVEQAKRVCPHCKARVARGATVCIYCEGELAPLMNPIEFQERFGRHDNA